MAQQASIVKPDASGGFKLPIRQGDAARIDVVDVDLVVHGKDGSRYVLAGAGIEAMSDRPPQVGFADGAVSAASLLENVGVVETPELSIPVMSSLTERDVKTSEGDKSFHGDGTNEVAATTAQLEAQAEAQSQSEQMSPVAEASDATVEKMVEAVEKQVSKLHDKAADPAPVEAFEPPTAPAAGVGAAPNPVSLTPLLVLSMGNVSDTSASSGTTYQGTGGVADSAVLKYIDARDALQITMETIAGTAGNDVIYADGTSVGGVSYSATGTVSGTATFAKDFAVQISGYFTTLTAVTVTISGNSTPISIVGGTDLGGRGVVVAADGSDRQGHLSDRLSDLRGRRRQPGSRQLHPDPGHHRRHPGGDLHLFQHLTPCGSATPIPPPTSAAPPAVRWFTCCPPRGCPTPSTRVRATTRCTAVTATTSSPWATVTTPSMPGMATTRSMGTRATTWSMPSWAAAATPSTRERATTRFTAAAATTPSPPGRATTSCPPGAATTSSASAAEPTSSTARPEPIRFPTRGWPPG